MLTEPEYSQLVQDCLELLRKKGMEDAAQKLQAIISKPVIEEPPPSDGSRQHISEAKERPPTPKEQLQAVVAFLEAHLLHAPGAISRLATITRHGAPSLEWAAGEGVEGETFSGTELSVDAQSLTEISAHLQILREAAEMPETPLGNLP